MADNEDVKGPSARGNDWEVVSLSASAYAAPPCPVQVKDDDNTDVPTQEKPETSSALFLSRHFTLHLTQHEDQPLETSGTGVLDKRNDTDDFASVDDATQGRSSGKDEKDWTFKGLSVPVDFPGLPFHDEKGVRLSVHGPASEEGKNALQGLKTFSDKDQSVYGSAALSSFDSDAASGVPPSYVKNTTIPKVPEASEAAACSSADISHQPEQIEGDKLSGFHLPCGAWWKRRAASFYSQAKEAKAFWSVFIAAAVMGLVILGQRWQQEKGQVLQLRWHLSINNEVCLVVMLSPWS